jgi:hypothetical protein
LRSSLRRSGKNCQEEFNQLFPAARTFLLGQNTKPIAITAPQYDKNLLGDDAETRKSLIATAAAILKEDSTTLNSFCAKFNLAPGATTDTVERLFPEGGEDHVKDEELTLTFEHFTKSVLDVVKMASPMSPSTLVALRDIAICLSLPRNHRLDALKQLRAAGRFTSLPTADRELAKLIIARTIGRIPGRLTRPIPRHEVLNRIHDGEIPIVDVTDDELNGGYINTESNASADSPSTITGLAALEIEGSVIHFEEPPESGPESAEFLSDFCFGLASALQIEGCDLSDRAIPPSYDWLINDALDCLSTTLDVKVCVFITKERPTEISTLRGWFPRLEIVRMADTEHKEYRRLKYRVMIYDKSINHRNPRV